MRLEYAQIVAAECVLSMPIQSAGNRDESDNAPIKHNNAGL